ncbi:precorrin-3B C(17)-methyltransferase [Haloferax volcanii]|uniref:Precorrin-3B C(17)-methyltransferase n=2 Tax=Haloferax volcanii TaxID=2246 RepID=A0A6C0URP1_HALVO|nr:MULTISPECIES: precorrin-3B C(17)-methyltransferase [Haloferax]ELK54356.1 precorrin-3B C17-methyltransferase [Haloferax sp. BAB-2207]ELZ95604.1 precorrin-3B C17-methyltransferase [Haloferax alexandrinus JCM 10717]NLV03234.1 precorrin-3B C(17)-methyltransferase [Haloferax alexandrinus]QIB77877.1 precorrin-3B C(17)-methyltransferase [Haloferax alexandrinus]TVT94992.1 precorrin-3B C(17)-methyltransferase [Haloferax volcanii]
MSDSDTTTESNCGGATTESTESTDTTNSESNCGGTKTETETDTTSNCGASSSTTDDDSASKCGGSSGGSKKEQTAEKVEATIEDFDGEPGQLVAVGLGPGRASEMTTLAKDTLREADHIVGYTTYIELLPDDVVEGAEDIYSTPMCGEVSRTEEAVDRALAGNDVAIVGSGDPNVYALAGLALEILESKGATASMVDFDVVAGVPAAQSCAARLGAPLVNDTVTISLSDHLTSMPTIESRLHAAAKEGFTIAIYNPWSRKRRSNYEKCCEILLEHRAPDTPVGIVHGAGRDDEEVEIVELGDLPDLGETDLVDMTTTLLVGNEETYVWDDRMVTPRGYEQKYEY